MAQLCGPQQPTAFKVPSILSKNEGLSYLMTLYGTWGTIFLFSMGLGSCAAFAVMRHNRHQSLTGNIWNYQDLSAQ